TFADFITKVVNPQRIEDARRNLAENLGLLQRVQQRFGVQPRFIVALWGVESDFGKTQGSYSVRAALTDVPQRGDHLVEDYRSGPYPRRQHARLLGGRNGAMPVHALDLSQLC